MTGMGEILSQIGKSLKDLVQKEMELAKLELKDSAVKVFRHSSRTAIFGLLLLISALPFLAFLIIGIGELLNDNYWLSSLFVSVIFAVIGGSMAVLAYRQIKKEDLTLPRTRESIQNEMETMTKKAQELKATASGSVRDIQDRIKRRAS